MSYGRGQQQVETRKSSKIDVAGAKYLGPLTDENPFVAIIRE